MKAYTVYEALRDLTDALHSQLDPEEQKELLELLEADVECRLEVQRAL